MTVSERELFRGYGQIEVTRSCVCGGSISAPLQDETRIRLAVEFHNSTMRHRRWRKVHDRRLALPEREAHNDEATERLPLAGSAGSVPIPPIPARASVSER